MQLNEFDHQSIIEKARRDFAPFYDQLRWITDEAARKMSLERQELLDFLSSRALTAFNRTKPYTRSLSPGCLFCGSGSWSCLFINSICNARCFYCPSEQKTADEPGTNTLTFIHPKDYVDYLDHFGFQGASISGGEPFMTFERTLSFVAGIKRHFGERMYVWLYTNGILADEDKLKRLKHAGLDEIRFNIGAVNFSLDRVSQAVGVVPRVTVEIPAVPERLDLLSRLIFEMNDLGVDFLNLHQIRCTSFNYPKLISRGYTFVHGPFIGAAESEIAALRLLRHAAESGIEMGVNYCSLIYRHRFQTRSARRRWAQHVKKEYEDITDTGMIRRISAAADPGVLKRISEGAEAGEAGCTPFSEGNGRLSFSRSLLDLADVPWRDFRVSYYLPSIHPRVTYRNPYREIRLNQRSSVILERAAYGAEIGLDPVEAGAFRALTGAGPDDLDDVFRLFPGIRRTPESQEKWKKILHAERIRSGLLEYY